VGVEKPPMPEIWILWIGGGGSAKEILYSQALPANLASVSAWAIMADLINPTPQLFGRKETSQLAVSMPLSYLICKKIMLSRRGNSSTQYARTLESRTACPLFSTCPLLQRTTRTTVEGDEREPIDALEIFEVGYITLITNLGAFEKQ